MVTRHKILDKKTVSAANSVSAPYVSAKMVPTAAAGIDIITTMTPTKTGLSIGTSLNPATVRSGKIKSRIRLAVIASRLQKICFTSPPDRVIPVINIESGVVTLDRWVMGVLNADGNGI